MVAKNFKFLYKYFGDKQEILAKMFEVHQSDISGYVNGSKSIPVGILQKISMRYGVSIDDLSNKDLSLEFDEPQTIDAKDTMKLGQKMFPILTSNIAETNDNFERAQSLLFDSLNIERAKDFYPKVNLVEYAIKLYQTAWKESGTYVALSNSISAILLTYCFYCNRGIQVTENLLSKGQVSLLDIQRSLLCNPKEPAPPNPYEEKKKAFFVKYEGMVYDSIKLLKKNTHFSELGDYYLAMCSLCGFAEDFLDVFADYKNCFCSGLYMLFQLYKLENKYAESFFDSLPPSLS